MAKSTVNAPPTAADVIQFVDRDLDLFEGINDGEEHHLAGGESLPPVEPLTKAWDVAYIRFSVPDLDLYERWVQISDSRSSTKTTGDIFRGLQDGFCHVAHKGPASFSDLL